MNLDIDLSGLEHKWGNSNKCAICGFDFDNQEPTDDPDFEYEVPLQLFRGQGDDCKMLAFCFKCAEIRMQNKAAN